LHVFLHTWTVAVSSPTTGTWDSTVMHVNDIKRSTPNDAVSNVDASITEPSHPDSSEIIPLTSPRDSSSVEITPSTDRRLKNVESTVSATGDGFSHNISETNSAYVTDENSVAYTYHAHSESGSALTKAASSYSEPPSFNFENSKSTTAMLATT